ncbi:TPA: hypothetical protein ACY3HR_003316 [Citrobacter freundii]
MRVYKIDCIIVSLPHQNNAFNRASSSNVPQAERYRQKKVGFVVANCRVKKLNREDQHRGATDKTHLDDGQNWYSGGD